MEFLMDHEELMKMDLFKTRCVRSNKNTRHCMHAKSIRILQSNEYRE